MKKITKKLMQRDERGSFYKIDRGGEWREITFSSLNKGYVRGGHYHKKTTELILIVFGRCQFEIISRKGEERTWLCSEGEGAIISPYEGHTLKALVNSKVVSLLSLPYDRGLPDTFSS